MTRRNLILGVFLSAGALCAADDLPKGDTILDKYVEVTGGKAAYEKVKTEITTGTMSFGAMGLNGKMIAYKQAPANQVVEVTLDAVGKIVEGVTGDVAWSLNPVQGPRVKEGEEKTVALQQARMNPEGGWREMYKSAETVGQDTVDGKECYKVVLTPKDGSGKPVTRWYEKKSNLLVKMSMTNKSPMGEIEVESLVGDYRKEGDILMPHKNTSKAAGQEFTMTIDSVQVNVDIPKDKFEPPAEIKALLNKPAAPAKQ